MSAWDIIGPCRRRWYLLLIGVLVTLGVAANVHKATGVYFSQVNFVLLAPASTTNPNAMRVSSSSLVDMAAILQREVDGQSANSHSVSPSVTIVDEGMRHGYLVRLPNTGSQWISIFSQPVLDVQAVGTSLAETRATMDAILARIQTALNSRQQAAGVAQVNMITARLSPATPPYYYEAGKPSRAALLTVILGICVALGLVLVIDEKLQARSAARYARQPQRHAPLVS